MVFWPLLRLEMIFLQTVIFLDKFYPYTTFKTHKPIFKVIFFLTLGFLKLKSDFSLTNMLFVYVMAKLFDPNQVIGVIVQHETVLLFVLGLVQWLNCYTLTLHWYDRNAIILLNHLPATHTTNLMSMARTMPPVIPSTLHL